MVQSLQNVTATPNVPLSSVTTTAPYLWQVKCSVACSQTWPTTCSGQGGLTAPCLPLCPSFLPDVQGKILCSILQPRLGQLMYSGTKTGNAPMTAGCPTLWSQPESTAPSGKKRCWCISAFTAGQSAGIYFWNMKSRISITMCISITWIIRVPHFSTYATKLGLSTMTRLQIYNTAHQMMLCIQSSLPKVNPPL